MQVAMRDISCRVTQCKEGTQIAHIIPASETEWFMSQGLSSVAEFDDASNAILLRSDVHKIFDSKYFTIVPKHPDQECVLIAHVFGRNCPEEVIRLYHDVPMQPLYGIKMEFLLARFAWTIFDSVKIFLEQNVPRRLKVKGENGEVQEKVCSPQECRSHASRPRSTSPSKRARATQPATVEGNRAHKRRRSSSTSGSGSTTFSKLASQERTLEFTNQVNRGRKKRRSFSPGLSSTENSDSYLELSTTEISETSFTDEEKEARTWQGRETSRHVSVCVDYDEIQ